MERSLQINQHEKIVTFYEGEIISYGFGDLKHMRNHGILNYNEIYQEWLVGDVPLSNILRAKYQLEKRG